jgi:hypothetical protein
MSQEGFFKELFDTRFTTLITPKIIRVLYILAIVAIGIGALIFVVTAFASDTAFGILALLILAPLGFLLYVIVARVYLEIVIVAFKIREAAQAIASNTSGLGGGGAAASAPPAPPAPPATGLTDPSDPTQPSA